MRIGIISDSHGQIERLTSAMAILARRGAQAVVHCGDVGTVACLRALAGGGMAAYAVAGNMDSHHLRELIQAARSANVQYSTELVAVDVGGGKHLAATHGHDETLLEELIVGQQFAYVCHGHTHRVRDDRYRAVRVINPGALHHSRRPGYPTAALLDTDTDQLSLLRVANGQAGGHD